MSKNLKSLEDYIKELPDPLPRSSFKQSTDKIWDSEEIGVYSSEENDFAFLFPPPSFDYENYNPRSAKLGLTDAKKTEKGIQERFEKIKPFFDQVKSFLEIGAANGNFIQHIHDSVACQELACVEPDRSTLSDRRGRSWLKNYDSLDEVIQAGARFDLIGFFHVFEHVLDPSDFLAALKKALAINGKILFEVPSLKDPLISLFDVKAYHEFYFQKQHPFVYSLKSIQKVLNHNGWEIVESVEFQRYGIGNHLQWMCSGKPGGNAVFEKVFEAVDAAYRKAIEEYECADSIIVLAQPQ